LKNNVEREVVNNIKVFLSSVFDNDFSTGFKYERETVKQLLEGKPTFEIISLDNFNSSPGIDGTLLASLKSVESSDVVLLFIGKNYGGTLITQEDLQRENIEKYTSLFYDKEEMLSHTHLEFRYAKSLRKPILIYMFSFDSKDEKQQKFIDEIKNYNVFRGKYFDVVGFMDQSNMFEDILSVKQGKNIKSVLEENDKKSYAYFISMKILADLHEVNNAINNSVIKRSFRILDFIDKSQTYFAVVTHIKSELQTSEQLRKQIIRDKKIDQKFLYLNPNSINEWKNIEEGNAEDRLVIGAKAASESFKKCIESSLWKNLLKVSDTYIDIGVGVGVKTEKVLEQIINESIEHPFYIVPIDYSPSMLDIAIKRLSQHLHGKKKSIFIDGIRMDFMEMSDAKELLQNDKDKHSIFSFWGGTLGNIDEEKFINNLKSVMQKDDIFVLTYFVMVNQVPDYKEIIQCIASPLLRELGFRFKERHAVLTSSEQIEDEPLGKRDEVIIQVCLDDVYESSSCDNVRIQKSTRYNPTAIENFLLSQGFRYYDNDKSNVIFEDNKKITRTVIFKYKG